MTIGQEPPGGDFVAYLKVLEQESAARLHIAPVPIDTAKAAAEAKAAGHDGMAPVLDRAQADALRARLAGGDNRDSAPVIALAIGIGLTLLGVIGDGGLVPLGIGIGLILWSVTRLQRLRAARNAAPAPVVDRIFHGRPGA